MHEAGARYENRLICKRDALYVQGKHEENNKDEKWTAKIRIEDKKERAAVDKAGLTALSNSRKDLSALVKTLFSLTVSE